MTDGPVVVRSRRAAVVGGVWMLTAAVLFVSGVLLLVDDGRIWLELPLAVPAFVIGFVTWRSRVVFSPLGIDITEGWRRRYRVLWGVVARVTVDTTSWFWRVPVWVELTDGSTILLPSCWGTSRRRRVDLVAEVAAVAAAHEVPVEAAAGGPGPGSATTEAEAA
jgi:hypothetical protein